MYYVAREFRLLSRHIGDLSVILLTDWTERDRTLEWYAASEGHAPSAIPQCLGNYPHVEKYILTYINPLGPHDALKHHFTSLKISIIFLQPRVLERKFP